jgi:hypothetical protein
MLLLTSSKTWSGHDDIPSVCRLLLLPESAQLLFIVDRSNIGGDLVSLEVLRIVGSKAMSSGVNKSPDSLHLGLMSLKHPLLLVTNPVVVLNKSKLLFLESLITLWSLVGIVVVQISMSRDRSFDIWLLSGRNEGCSSVIVANEFDLSISLSQICTLSFNVGLRLNHWCRHGPSSPLTAAA